MPEPDQNLDQEFRRTTLIWCGLLGSLIIYLLIGYLIRDQIRSGEPQLQYRLFRNIVFLIAAAHFMGTFVFKKAWLQVNTNRPGASPTSHEKGLAKYRSGSIITWALSEAIAVYGFLFLILFGDFQNFAILLAIAAFALFMHRPKKEEMIRMITQL